MHAGGSPPRETAHTDVPEQSAVVVHVPPGGTQVFTPSPHRSWQAKVAGQSAAEVQGPNSPQVPRGVAPQTSPAPQSLFTVHDSGVVHSVCPSPSTSAHTPPGPQAPSFVQRRWMERQKDGSPGLKRQA